MSGGNGNRPATGKLDPHLEITRLSSGDKLNSSFTFDFHGMDGNNYCAISDNRLEVNVQMFSLPSEAVVLERPVEEADPLFEGTWMKGFGILYHDQNQEPHRISILLDPAADRLGEQPFNATCDKIPVMALDAPGPVVWKSPDGLATIVREASRINSLVISFSDLLEMEVLTDSEKELIADPPVHFLNFNVRNITTTPEVHGFLGQMFAPGAIPERLNMGTLDGLRHREYVEGTDEEYATSSLTEEDCSFSRFNKHTTGIRIKSFASRHAGVPDLPFEVVDFISNPIGLRARVWCVITLSKARRTMPPDWLVLLQGCRTLSCPAAVGCIPVLFQRASAYDEYTSFLPADESSYSSSIPEGDIIWDGADIFEAIRRIPEAELERKRAVIASMLPSISYEDHGRARERARRAAAEPLPETFNPLGEKSAHGDALAGEALRRVETALDAAAAEASS
ncbi:hypothetical protein KFL_000460170 [Klebsormidium nitens]|uniref:Uncharacterized protein n=1 Tax=Klebsormidium nitens TaxID=105231 RepID=A0A1Y1HUA4_KLENI|nr:hypothetical protein KFL_000460170 [Klebsormidium nitens]|eukprot:GAQ80106.1 hypothetical protein KFL_000460170 [Klebsormidium nitens]